MKKFFDYILHNISKPLPNRSYTENIPFITVGLLSGLVCCLYAKLFAYAETFAAGLLDSSRYFILLSPLLIAGGYAVVYYFAKGANGSGIPQVIACIETKNESAINQFLNIKIIVVKIASSLVALLGGAAIGREGPSLQVAASIGNIVTNLFDKINIKIKQEQMILAGAAGGLAAAFNTPIGGIVYAIEELAHDHIRSYKTVLLISVLISGFTAQLLMGNYLYLGYPDTNIQIELYNVFMVAFTGFVGGILGSVFSKLLLKLLEFQSSLSLKNKMLLILVVGLGIAGSFFALGTHAIFSGKESINFVLFSKDDIPASELIFRFLNPIFSSGTGIAGGIFAPSLSAGATFG
ncbi:MAG: chloride channel protein, partial [Pseudobdellovibrio sp.]